MFATRAATRIALRSSPLRRGIHSGVRGDWPRSSAATVGLVLASAGAAFGTYVSYKNSEPTKSTSGNKHGQVRQKTAAPAPAPAPASKPSAPKSQDNASVDSPASVKPAPSEPGVIEPTATPTSDSSSDKPADSDKANDSDSSPDKEKDKMDSLEADAASQGAFNPETGEINWDCPCLGGMAHGPCGPQFREAFSCFVYSEQEPKGVDCVEKFKAMQDCFREHPDVYGEEVDDDEEAPGPNPDSPDAVKEPEAPVEDKPSSEPEKSSPEPEKPSSEPEKPSSEPEKPSSEPVSDAPAPPAKEPESRERAPTAKVSPEETPSKSEAKH